MKLDKIIAAIVLTLIIVLGSQGYCATSQPRPNSLDLFDTYESPYMYMVGAPVRLNLFEDTKGHYFTNVEFKALGASMLNTVPLLFCGSVEEAFADTQLRAVTYRIKATRSYQGVGCHDILPTNSGVIAIEGGIQ